MRSSASLVEFILVWVGHILIRGDYHVLNAKDS